MRLNYSGNLTARITHNHQMVIPLATRSTKAWITYAENERMVTERKKKAKRRSRPSNYTCGWRSARARTILRAGPTSCPTNRYTSRLKSTRTGEERVVEIAHTHKDRILIVAWTPRDERRVLSQRMMRTRRRARFADQLYKNRAAINKKAQAAILSGSRQVTIRLSNSEIALAKQQAESRGLKYQTYIKILLHEALATHA